MNKYNKMCNCNIVRERRDILEIVGECVCDDGLEYIRNIVGDDIGDMIESFKFDMEREDREMEHREKFDDCLDEIRGKRFKKMYKDILENFYFEEGYGFIDVEIDGEFETDEVGYDGVLYSYNVRIDNVNDWFGFSSEDLLNDVLFNYRDLNNYDSRVEFIEDMFESNGEDYDEENEDYDKYIRWWGNMLKYNCLIDDLLTDLGWEDEDKEEFREWISCEI